MRQYEIITRPAGGTPRVSYEEYDACARLTLTVREDGRATRIAYGERGDGGDAGEGGEDGRRGTLDASGDVRRETEDDGVIEGWGEIVAAVVGGEVPSQLSQSLAASFALVPGKSTREIRSVSAQGDVICRETFAYSLGETEPRMLARTTAAYSPTRNADGTLASITGTTVTPEYHTYGVEVIDAGGNTVGRGDLSAPPGDTTTWLYDEASGVMTNKLYADGKGPRYTYTDDGKLASRTWARGVVTTYAYDEQTGRLATMQVPTTTEGEEQNHCPPPPAPLLSAFHWTYYPGSDLKSQLVYPNGLTATWTYDANNQLLQVCNATPTNVISQYDYTYDVVGRRVACVRSGAAMSVADTIAYAYNVRGELTNAVSDVDANYAYSYQYDDIGNRITSEECGVRSAEYVANELNQYTQIDTASSAFSASPCETFNPEFDDSCKEGCFSYCLTINDLYDFDAKGIPGFTSRSAKGEIVTWLVNITETCLRCEWATFYHVGSFCGKD